MSRVSNEYLDGTCVLCMQMSKIIFFFFRNFQFYFSFNNNNIDINLNKLKKINILFYE